MLHTCEAKRKKYQQRRLLLMLSNDLNKLNHLFYSTSAHQIVSYHLIYITGFLLYYVRMFFFNFFLPLTLQSVPSKLSVCRGIEWYHIQYGLWDVKIIHSLEVNLNFVRVNIYNSLELCYICDKFVFSVITRFWPNNPDPWLGIQKRFFTDFIKFNILDRSKSLMLFILLVSYVPLMHR